MDRLNVRDFDEACVDPVDSFSLLPLSPSGDFRRVRDKTQLKSEVVMENETVWKC